MLSGEQVVDDSLHFWFLPPSEGERDRLCDEEGRCLSPGEREKQRAMAGGSRARRYLLGRILLRQALGSYLDCDPAELVFGETANGKLFLTAPEGTGIDFSLTHSRSESVVAVARAQGVGVDIEQLRRSGTVLKIAQRHFPEAERRHLAALDEGAGDAALSLWTLKESVTKALGSTIWKGLGDVSLSVQFPGLTWLRPPPQGRAMDWGLLLGRFRQHHCVSAALWRPGLGQATLTWKTHQLGGGSAGPDPLEVVVL